VTLNRETSTAGYFPKENESMNPTVKARERLTGWLDFMTGAAGPSEPWEDYEPYEDLRTLLSSEAGPAALARIEELEGMMDDIRVLTKTDNGQRDAAARWAAHQTALAALKGEERNG
jgi:hypothetical protein